MKEGVRRSLDWGSFAPLRVRCRQVADGLFAGSHKSLRRGSGIEFGGHREYAPGDDLRWLDRRSMLRHDHLLVRQFETETERALRMLVDATASMRYRSGGAPGAKLAFACLIAAALGRVALGNGDPFAVSFMGGIGARDVPVSSGNEAFERLLSALEALSAEGDALLDPAIVDRALALLSRATRRGSVVVVFSDLLDLPPSALEWVGGLATRGRSLVVVRVLDPDELTFPFEGTVRLRGLEGDVVVESDAKASRATYLAALDAIRERWERALVQRGARLVTAATADDPVRVVRAVLEAVR